MNESTKSLLAARDSREALTALFQKRKSVNPRYSLAKCCNAAGIPSTGYLSDIFKGRRQLPNKYWGGVVRAFELDELEGRYLKLLLEIDQADEEERVLLRARLHSLHKAILINRWQLNESLERSFFSFEVFVAFGLFQGAPTEEQLESYFGSDQKVRVRQALDHLCGWKMIHKRRDRYELVENFVMFDDSVDGRSHLDFVRSALWNAHVNLKKWFKNSRESHFSATMISVNKERYLEQLAQFKADLKLVQSNLETTDGDLIVHFNVQVFPAV